MKFSVPVVLAFLAGCAVICHAQNPMSIGLTEAKRIALTNNPRLGGAKLRAAAAYQIPTEIRSALQPNISGNLTGVAADSGSRIAAGALNNPIVYNRLASGVSVSQLLTDFGRTGNLAESATLRARAQDQITGATSASILLAADVAYFGLLRARSVLTVAEHTEASRKLVVDQVSALAEAKQKSALDVSFAEVNLADATLLLADARNRLAAAQVELATALGLPSDTEFILTEEPLPPPVPDDINAVLTQALQRRPDLVALRLEHEAAGRMARAEKALSYPTIAMVGTAGAAPLAQAAIPGQYAAAGVNVNVPIFNGGLFKARVAEADLRAQAIAKDVSDLTNRIVRDARVAYLDARTALDRMNLTARFLERARLAAELAQSRYDLGLGSIVELSQAQLNVTTAEISSAAAKYDYQTRRAVLAFQLGELR